MTKNNCLIALFTHRRPYHTKKILKSLDNFISKKFILLMTDGVIIQKKNSSLKRISFKFPLKHPLKLKASSEYDHFCSQKVFSMPSLKNRIINKIIKILK